MLRKLSCFCLAMVIISNLSANKIFAQCGEEITLKEMCNQSTDIIIAKIVSKNSYHSFDKKDVFTDVTLKVTKKIKGKFNANENMKIITYGGTIDGITTYVVGAPTFQINTSSILFLAEIKSKTTGKITNHRIIGSSQGKFDVVDDNNVKKIQRKSDYGTLILDESRNNLDLSHGKAINFDNFIKNITKYL